jgi:hypothetical protein
LFSSTVNGLLVSDMLSVIPAENELFCFTYNSQNCVIWISYSWHLRQKILPGILFWIGFT